jgi:hypothetical protein
MTNLRTRNPGDRDRDRDRARRREINHELREQGDTLDDADAVAVPTWGPAWPQAGEDLPPDEGPEEANPDPDGTVAELPAAAGRRLTLEDVVGSRPPLVLFRLVRTGENVHVEPVVAPRPGTEKAFKDLQDFLEGRLAEGPRLLGDDWSRLLDGDTPVGGRLLLLTRLAIRGQTMLAPGRDSRTPNDIGLERYGKYALLPDGVPFSLRLLLEDGRGRHKGNGPATFIRLPYAVQLCALRAALDRERGRGEAVSDDDFVDLLHEALREMGIELNRQDGVRHGHVTELRRKLKKCGAADLFPNEKQRRREYAQERGGSGADPVRKPALQG